MHIITSFSMPVHLQNYVCIYFLRVSLSEMGRRLVLVGTRWVMLLGFKLSESKRATPSRACCDTWKRNIDLGSILPLIKVIVWIAIAVASQVYARWCDKGTVYGLLLHQVEYFFPLSQAMQSSKLVLFGKRCCCTKRRSRYKCQESSKSAAAGDIQ